MGRRLKQHRVLNVYGEDAIETVENALGLAMVDGAEDEAEAIREIAAAYAGYDAADDLN